MTETRSGDTVMVRVERLLSFGILVRLSDGSSGIIREREIAWEYQKRRTWQQRFKVGDMLQAVSLGPRHDERHELSLRLAESDPWIGIETRHPLGEIVDGYVTGVQRDGVFIEIRPGIVGRLHISRIPPWAQSHNPEDLFWPGDHVRTMIEKIDPKNRQIGLSLTRALSQRWRDQQSSSSPAQQHILSHAEPSEPSTRPIDIMFPPLRIVVVEDDPTELTTIARWMRQSGLEPLTVSDADQALVLIEREQPDMVLTDFGLPGKNGIDALQEIRSRWPALRCALMTDWARASEHLSEIEALRADGVRLLLKPLRPEDLAAVLSEREDKLYTIPDPAPSLEIVMPAGELLPMAAPRDQQINAILSRLCTTTGAVKAALFMLDMAQRQVSIVAEVGATALNLEAVVDLIHSPVRDVVEDRVLLRVEDVQQVEPLVRYLKPLLPFRSCLGIQVPVQLAEGYGLFLFSPRPRAFTELHESHLAATALTVSALLEREQFQWHALELQRLALLGQLSRALVHEISHHLSPITFVLREFEQRLEAFEQHMQAPENLALDLQQMHELFADLARGVHNLTNTAHTFGQITVHSRQREVDVGQLIGEVAQLLRDTADRNHVELEINVPADLPLVRTQPVQIQQIMLNIGLNAIQQIALTRPGSGGRILIRPKQQEVDHRSVIQVAIEDDGPGIHRQLWARVFDLGFTTRSEGGSGLGLYITRSLAESLGGRVYIAESYMLWGTTFVIELPIIA